MKKSFVEAWLVALRSGEYKQFHGSVNNGVYSYHPDNQTDDRVMLTAPNAFCCIGVAAVCNGMDVRDMRITNHASKYIGLYGLPLPDKEDELIDFFLIDMNDKQKKSFPEIADWIEANILPDATEE